jgi:PAS domain S-box-containing protein
VPTRTRQHELVGFWLALALLAGVAAFAYMNIDVAGDTLARVDRANQARRQFEAVFAAYSRATSARREYIVTGNATQLADTPELDAQLARAVAALRTSLADSPDQLGRLDSLAGLLHERMRSLDAGVEQRRLSGVGTESREGLELGARVRAVREEMEAAGDRILAERGAVTVRGVQRTKIAEILGTLASFAVLIVAFRRLRREIARRRESEQALRRSEGFLDSIVENIPDMIFVKEAVELRFERINRAGEALLGIDRKELLRKNDFDFFPSEQAESFQARDRETLANRVIVDIPEEPIDTKTGGRWLHTKKVPIVDEEGVPRYLLGISEDITGPREAAAALKLAKEAAETANGELEAFSYAVAHDLRAPLRAIHGFSAALVEDFGEKLDVEAKGHLERIGAGATRMGELIDALLGLSRVTRTELARESVNLTEMARSVADNLQAADPTHHVELEIERGLLDDGDPRLLRALLENLIGNAWKFASKQKNARIEFGRQNGDVHAYFVRDNGAGFDMAYSQKLFAPFQRLHPASDFSGTGIGLATVQRIVRRHGGRVWAEGAVNQGATFHFTLGDAPTTPTTQGGPDG